jgi:hypothetical protein
VKLQGGNPDELERSWLVYADDKICHIDQREKVYGSPPSLQSKNVTSMQRSGIEDFEAHNRRFQ